MIEADYPTLLTNLLHYPAPSSTYPFEPSLILSQAVFLRGNITSASGVQVVIQNQDTLGVKAQPPERSGSEAVSSNRGWSNRGRGRGRVSINSQSQGQVRGSPGASAGAGVQGFAQGWIDRAQAAGLDKAVLSAVSDLRVSYHSHPPMVRIKLRYVRSGISQTLHLRTPISRIYLSHPSPRQVEMARSPPSPLPQTLFRIGAGIFHVHRLRHSIPSSLRLNSTLRLLI